MSKQTDRNGNWHCAGCVKHGTLEDLKRITVHGDECDGVDLDGEIQELQAKIAKMTEEMNTIIRQKWEVERERDELRKELSVEKAMVRFYVKDKEARSLEGK